MKRIMLVLAGCLTACGPGLQAAKTSVTAIRVGLGVADVGIAEADRVSQQACMENDNSLGDVYKKCRAAMEKTLVIYSKAKKVASSSLDAAEAGIRAYEANKAGKEVDIWQMIKKGGCAVLSLAMLIPEGYRVAVQFYINLAVAGLGCPK